MLCCGCACGLRARLRSVRRTSWGAIRPTRASPFTIDRCVVTRWLEGSPWGFPKVDVQRYDVHVIHCLIPLSSLYIYMQFIHSPPSVPLSPPSPSSPLSPSLPLPPSLPPLLPPSLPSLPPSFPISPPSPPSLLSYLSSLPSLPSPPFPPSLPSLPPTPPSLSSLSQKVQKHHKSLPDHNTVDSDGDTLLHAYIRRKDKHRNECLLALLVYGNCDVDKENGHGFTPLHIAAEVSVERVKVLCVLGV